MCTQDVVAEAAKYHVLNGICLGTCFQLAEVVRAGVGQPSSAKCLEIMKKPWVSHGPASQIPCNVIEAYIMEAY